MSFNHSIKERIDRLSKKERRSRQKCSETKPLIHVGGRIKSYCVTGALQKCIIVHIRMSFRPTPTVLAMTTHGCCHHIPTDIRPELDECREASLKWNSILEICKCGNLILD